MQVPRLALAITHFAQQDRPSVPKRRHVMTKLVARVQHGNGLAPRQEEFPAHGFMELRALGFIRVQVNQGRGRRIETDQM